MSVRWKIWLFGLIVMPAFCCFAQTAFTSLKIPTAATASHPGMGGERHLQDTPAGSLYANSAFAHGFRHGYDEGFYAGDVDWQLGRQPRTVISSNEYGRAVKQYRPEFGSKRLFELGCQAGFRSGYSDVMSGGEYSMRSRMESASAGMSFELLSPSRRGHFDEGFANGFRSAQSANAPTKGMTVEYVESYCRTTASGPYALEYCSGFSRGYLLGIFNAPKADSGAIASLAKAIGDTQ